MKKASGMDHVFFTNSGTEAIEGAFKAARKYAYRETVPDVMSSLQWRILSMEEASEHCPSPE